MERRLIKRVLVALTAVYCVGVGVYALSSTFGPKPEPPAGVTLSPTPTPPPMPKGLQIGDMAPNFTLPDLAGNKETLAQYHGKKPVLVEIFATWCPHCQHSVPFMKKMEELYGKRIRILAVNAGDKPGEATTAYDFRQAFFVTYTILDSPPQSFKDAYKLGSIPAIYLIDRRGKVIWTRQGAPDDTVIKSLESKNPKNTLALNIKKPSRGSQKARNCTDSVVNAQIFLV